jgi:DNA-binding MarR family transcriptional regulator
MRNNSDFRFEVPNDATLGNLRSGFEFLQAFNAAMGQQAPLSYQLAFLLVAMEPGHGTVHYAKKLGMHQPVISRILLEIGQKSRAGGPGLGLVAAEIDPTDLRARRYFLTPSGRALLDQITGALSRRRKGDD